MNTYEPKRLSRAVAAICPDILARVAHPAPPMDERRLWWELSSCILSSQVPYTLAVAATDAINAKCLLIDNHNDAESLASRIAEVLSKPLSVVGRLRSYRFPVARARHLAATHAAVIGEARSLRELIERFRNVEEARTWFVTNAPGIGPKQASMFLRNAGLSYNLAILDRHVLNYMSAIGLYSGKKQSIATLSQYQRHETTLRDHADDMNCPVGLLDWAIWIVMRVANRKMETIAI